MGRKISQLPLSSEVKDTDFFPKVDPTLPPSSANQRITGEDLASWVILKVSEAVSAATDPSYAVMFMKDNATPTVVTTVGFRYPALGTTEVFQEKSRNFTHIPSRNSLRYDGTFTAEFKVTCTFTVLSAVNNRIGVYIGKTPSGATQDATADRLSESEVYITTGGARPESGAVQTIVSLSEGDEIYLIVQNVTSTNDVTVEFMNMIPYPLPTTLFEPPSGP